MKILLPLTALGMLSTLFLFSKNFETSTAVPLTQIDLQQKAHDQGATNASFSGVTASGDEVSLTTTRSQPRDGDPRVFLAEDISAEYRLMSGAGIDITSDHGEMNQKQNIASLSGEVFVETTTGYTVQTDHLTARFDQLFAETTGPVTATAPAGDLTAGKMLLEHKAETGSAHLVFTDGVKLVYQPQPKED